MEKPGGLFPAGRHPAALRAGRSNAEIVNQAKEPNPGLYGWCAHAYMPASTQDHVRTHATCTQDGTSDALPPDSTGAADTTRQLTE